MQVEILSMLKLVSFESLTGNDFSERGTQAEAHCERILNRQLRYLDAESHLCLRTFCMHYYKTSATSPKVTELLFVFALNKPEKLLSLLVACLLFVNFDY